MDRTIPTSKFFDHNKGQTAKDNILDTHVVPIPMIPLQPYAFSDLPFTGCRCNFLRSILLRMFREIVSSAISA